MEREALCTLIDNFEPIPFRKGGEETRIYSVQELVQSLRELAVREPRVVILKKPNGLKLFIGFNGRWAAVEAYPDSNSICGWAATPSVPHSTEDMWITSEGEPSLFDAAWVMPVQEVIDIVTDVAEHSRLPGSVAWVNPQGERLG